ncbi:NUDIX domain-containing protein [Luedemannella flava]|uniref:8-oxo-dGTP diphosphatase n=1 Tax=Luedemannella flava TaxID=349316 RepID=A0ABP4YJJ5_9ACTN
MIVGAAIVRDGLVLACERATPAEVAGRWEFPGGKVEPGEPDEAALIRECEEELGVTIKVGERVGTDVPLGTRTAVLRVWQATLVDGEPAPLEHASLRWVAPTDLLDLDWLPADQPIVADLARELGAAA